MKFLIRKLNNSDSLLLAGDKKLLVPCLSYPSFIYRKVKEKSESGAYFFRKKRFDFTKFLVDKDDIFPSGFLPRVEDYCRNQGWEIEILGDENPEWVGKVPNLSPEKWNEAREILAQNGIVVRDDQKKLLRQMYTKCRGVILSPTGSGKTVMMAAFLKGNYDWLNALIVVETKDLVRQGVDFFRCLFPPEEIGFISETSVEPARITFTNIQKFHRYPASKYHDSIHVAIIDECHHVNSLKGVYVKTLRRLAKAPYRFGFTATMPYEPEGLAALEGHVGPVLGTVDIQELVEKKVLAKPVLKIRKVPYSHRINELNKYADVYTLGVVNNRIRNRMIMQDVRELVQSGRTVLILIKEVEHGENLKRMAEGMFAHLRFEYVYGDTPTDRRHEVKAMLQEKELDVVVASKIWREGINIPTLGAVINAAGGKYEIFPQQALGRGLRIAPGKEDVILIDYFDPSHNYLVDHFGHRITLYFDLGWL